MTITTYTISLTPAQVEAMEYTDAFSWQSYYDEANLLVDGQVPERVLDELDMEEADVRQAIADAADAAFDKNARTLTLVEGSLLEGDVRHNLESAIEGFSAVMTGTGRGKAIVNLLKKIKGDE